MYTAMAFNAEELGSSLLALYKGWNGPPSDAIIQSFIAKGANINTKDGHGLTVLHYAVMHGYLNVVLMLLAAEGIDICAKDEDQYTVLMYACRNHNVEIIKALLAALKKTPSFDINDKNTYGYTALMHSCMKSRADVTTLLLTVPRINTHLKNNQGKTALDYAKGQMNEDAMRALFQGELLPIQL
jgi:ankyrin repeat protein